MSQSTEIIRVSEARFSDDGIVSPDPLLRRRYMKQIAAFVLFCIIFAIIGLAVGASVVLDLAEWLRDNDIPGMILFFFVFIVWEVCFFPPTPFDILCGYVYGFSAGSVFLTMIAKLVAFSIMYAIGRNLLKQHYQQNISIHFTIMRAFSIELEDKPYVTSVLIRFAALPSSLKSYGSGAIDAPYIPFIAAGLLGSSVTSLLFVSAGSKIHEATSLSSDGSFISRIEELIIILIGFVCLFIFVFYIRRVIKKISREDRLRRQSSRTIVTTLVSLTYTPNQSSPSPTSSTNASLAEDHL